jgi:hypothetical protein
MPSIAELAGRLEAVGDDFAALGPDMTAHGQWPLAERFGTEPEASWGPPEVLAHVAEMLPYWLGEIERILDGPADEATPFGRIADDPIRIGIIGRDRAIPIRELLARVSADAHRVAARLRSLGHAQAARRGLHPRLGEMDLPAIVERFLVTHAEEHLRQLREILAPAG